LSYPGVINNPAYQAQIASRVAAGLNQTTIAKQLDVTQPTISRSVNLDSTKKLIEAARNDLFTKYLPLAVNNVGQVMQDFYNPETKEYCKDGQVRYFGFRASEKMLEAIGVMGSNTPNTVVQNFFTQTNTLISPVVGELLGLLSAKSGDLPAIEAEYEDK
jgi:hypothetical protein